MMWLDTVTKYSRLNHRLDVAEGTFHPVFAIYLSQHAQIYNLADLKMSFVCRMKLQSLFEEKLFLKSLFSSEIREHIALIP